MHTRADGRPCKTVVFECFEHNDAFYSVGRVGGRTFMFFGVFMVVFGAFWMFFFVYFWWFLVVFFYGF